MKEILKDVLDFLYQIQTSYKGSIGGIKTHYLPQLRVEEVDELADRTSQYINENRPEPITEEDLNEKLWTLGWSLKKTTDYINAYFLGEKEER